MNAFQQLLLGARRLGSGERLTAGAATAVVLMAAVAVIVPSEDDTSQTAVTELSAEGQTTDSTAADTTAADSSAADSSAEGGIVGNTGVGGPSGSAEVAGSGPDSGVENGGPGSSVAMGQGVTDTSIKVGVHIRPATAREGQKALAGAGGETTAYGDERDAAEAIIDYLNAQGGIAGREVIPVYDEHDGTQSSAAYQKACATFTQDNPVLAVVSNISSDGYGILAGCLAKAKTVYVAGRPYGIIDQVVLDRFAPYLYSPGLLRGERWGTVIDQLVAGEYFDEGARLGVIWTDDEPTRRSYEGLAKPRLADHGLKVTADAALSPVGGSADFGTASREMNQAVLRFRGEGVTHVLFYASNGWGPFFFLPAAESQGYRPRYALTSLENINGQVPQSPPAQFRRAVAVGWWPTLDVDFSQDPKDNPAQDLCERIIREAGVEVPSRFGFAHFNATCDGFFFLRAALDGAEALTSAGFRSAVDGFGTAYNSPMTYSTHFGPGRFDGVNATRLLAFDDGCGCFQYRDEWQPAP